MKLFDNLSKFKKYLENKPGVYCIKNIINSDMYIGSSKNIYERFQEHKRGMIKNNHPNIIIRHSVKKYNYVNFEFLVLKFSITTNKDILMQLEQDYIDKYKPKYNILKEAYRNSTYKHSKEAIEKIRLSGIGRITNNKICLQFDRSGVFLNEFKSCAYATKVTGINHANIIEVCHYWTYGHNKTNRKTAGGYIWKYKIRKDGDY